MVSPSAWMSSAACSAGGATISASSARESSTSPTAHRKSPAWVKMASVPWPPGASPASCCSVPATSSPGAETSAANLVADVSTSHSCRCRCPAFRERPLHVPVRHFPQRSSSRQAPGWPGDSPEPLNSLNCQPPMPLQMVCRICRFQQTGTSCSP